MVVAGGSWNHRAAAWRSCMEAPAQYPDSSAGAACIVGHP